MSELDKKYIDPIIIMKEHIASKVAIEWSRKKNPPLMDPWETDLLIKYVKKC